MKNMSLVKKNKYFEDKFTFMNNQADNNKKCTSLNDYIILNFGFK